MIDAAAAMNWKLARIPAIGGTPGAGPGTGGGRAYLSIWPNLPRFPLVAYREDEVDDDDTLEPSSHATARVMVTVAARTAGDCKTAAKAVFDALEGEDWITDGDDGTPGAGQVVQICSITEGGTGQLEEMVHETTAQVVWVQAFLFDLVISQ